jgi:hypothetical protein
MSLNLLSISSLADDRNMNLNSFCYCLSPCRRSFCSSHLAPTILWRRYSRFLPTAIGTPCRSKPYSSLRKPRERRYYTSPSNSLPWSHAGYCWLTRPTQTSAATLTRNSGGKLWSSKLATAIKKAWVESKYLTLFLTIE